MRGPVKLSIVTATNLLLIRRVLAVRKHEVVAVLANPRQQEPVVLRLIADLPLVGSDDGQYDFLADIGAQAVTQSDGWEQLQATEPANTRSASTTNAGSASSGSTTAPTTGSGSRPTTTSKSNATATATPNGRLEGA